MENAKSNSAIKGTVSLLRSRRQLVFTLAAAIALAAPAVAQNYTITDLGVVSTTPVAGATGDTDSNATAINASGTVVGYSGVYLASGGSFAFHAFQWTPSSKNGTTGTLSYLGNLPGAYCFNPASTVGGITTPASFGLLQTNAIDINSAGTVVGSSYTSSDGTCVPTSLSIHAVLYQNGTVQDLGVPPWVTPSGFYQIVPSSINDAGQIVGTVNLTDPWLYNGSFHDLGSLPGFSATTGKINSTGQIVGTVLLSNGAAGFVHTGTGPILATDQIGTLGGPNSVANGINDAGLIVGASSIGPNPLPVHAYLLNTLGQMFDLGTVGQSLDISGAPLSSSQANAINNGANDIVGSSDIDLSSVWQSSETSQHAVMWQNAGNLIDLNSLLPPSVASPFGTSSEFGPTVACPNKTCWELITATGINDLGQIVGEGLLATLGQMSVQRHAFLLTPLCAAAGGDTDGDGLCDDWETDGYTAPDGTKVDLPAMGSDPKHKDIFVQADYMISPSGGCNPTPPYDCVFFHTHQPTADAMASVTAAFASAPVGNPDGFTGVRLHVDCGPDCIMNPVTGATWGDMSLAQEIAEIPVLGNPPGTCTTPLDSAGYCWDAFNALKQTNFLMSRSPIFHYMIFAHSLGYKFDGTVTGWTGISESIPDSSFIVSLGGLTNDVGTRLQQAGTFMHELGHNLGLRHGGTDGINYKPNYLSVMNYFFQTEGLTKYGSGGLLDYSRFFSIPDLNEASLDENVGLNAGMLLDNYGTSWDCPNGKRKDFAVVNAAIDWNCDGLIGTGVAVDLNGYLDAFGNPIYDVLHGAEDWSRLIYSGGSIGAAGVGTPPPPYRNSDPETPVPADPEAPYRVAVITPGATNVFQGVSLNLTFAVDNTGTQQDTYSLTPVTQYPWWNLASVPATVTLAGGASQPVTIPVTVPGLGCASGGVIKAKFTLKAVSLTSSTVTDSGVAELDLMPTAGFSAVPSLTGLTQAAAQAAIVGAGFVVGTVTMQSSSTVPAGSVISQSPIACATVTTGSVVSLTVSSGPPLVAVPNIVGDTEFTAAFAIGGAGFALGAITTAPSSTVPQGEIISQSLTAGTLAALGSTVNFVLSSGPPPVAVPNLIGQTEQAAVAAILAAGLTVGTITPQMSSTVPEFIVTAQYSYAPGTLVAPGTTINFIFSSGSQKFVQVPDASGGVSGVTAIGLTVGTITPMLSSTVRKESLISQDPPVGTFVAVGTPVNVVYSAGPQLIPVANVVGQWQWTAVQGLFNTLDPSDQSLVPFGVTISRQSSTTVPDGYVISENPAAGTPALLGSPVNLVVSSGGPVIAVVPNTVTDPTQYGNLFGIGTEANAINAINAAGFVLGLVTTQPSPTVPLGYVISQNPSGGTLAPWDSSVSLVVSAGGASSVVIPNVVGLTQAAAVTAINEVSLPGSLSGDFLTYSFTTQSSATVPADNIISQNSPAGPAALQLNLAYNSFFGNIAFAPVNLVISAGPLAVPSYSYVGQFGGGGIAVNGGALTGLTRGKGQITPYGMAIDPVSRNIIVGDVADGMVRIFDANGNFKSYFGGPGLCGCAFDQSFLGFFPGDRTGDGLLVGRPAAIAVDPVNHNIVVVDDLGGRVLIFNSAGQFQSVFGSQGSAPGQFVFTPFFYPHVAIDPASENIIVTDSGNNRVEIFNSAGVYLSQFGIPWVDGGPGQLFNPSGVAIDPASHNIVVADWGDGRVEIFNSAGVYLSQFGTYGQGDGQFQEPNALAIDSVSHNIVVGDLGVGNQNTNVPINRIQVFDSTGNFLSKFGGPGTGNGQLIAGGELAVDPATRNILVGDAYRIDIFAIPSSATTTTTAVVASINPETTGQSVTFTATVTGNSPTGTIQFMDGSASLSSPVVLTGGAAALTLSTLSAGTHSITAIYSGDSSNANSTSPILSEVVSPKTAPIVTAPSAISIPATQSAGATSSASPALAAFLAGATEVENISPPPVQQPPQVGGAAVSNTTLFPVGTTTVTFSFKDSNGNVGSATSTVTVAVGTPRITGSTAGIGTDPSGAMYVNIVLTNTGTGDARSLTINALVFRTLSGTGSVTYNTTLSPALPLIIGNLDVGNAVTTKMYLNVPSTATRISITENGTVQDIQGTKYSYSTAEAVIP